jgi:hypothetical protein
VPRQFGKVDASARWPTCPNCQHKHQPDAACPKIGVWLVRGSAAGVLGVLWLKRPMPDGQWPVDQRLPRDDSFSWWVRAHCGHPGGARQFAFYEEGYADMYEWIFRENPCSWTRCPQYMIKNERGRR